MKSTNLEQQKDAQNSHPTQEHNRKKVRRRQIRQKLYKHIPLNMAQARKEIATALQLHRASTAHNQIMQSPQFLIPNMNPNTYHFDIPSQNLGLNMCLDHHFKSGEEGKLMGSGLFWSNNMGSIGESGKESKDVMGVEDSMKIDHQFGFDNVAIGDPKKDLEFPNWLSINDDLLQQYQNSNYDDLLQQYQNSNYDDLLQQYQNSNYDDMLQQYQNSNYDYMLQHSNYDDMLQQYQNSNYDDLLQQYQNSNYNSAQPDCFQDPHLSCLDIGEIEDLDGDWLA